MPTASRNAHAGFSLVETMVSLTLGLLMMGAVMTLFKDAVKMNTSVTQQSDMQQTARAALNLMAEDLSIAGTNFVLGGVQLPFGGGVTSPEFGYDTGGNHYFTKLAGVIDPAVSTTIPNARLYAVTPAHSLVTLSGSGIVTDAVTLVYQDPKLPLGDYALATVTDTSVRIDETHSDYVTAVTDAAFRVKPGDVLIVHNGNGDAAALVTSVSGDFSTFYFNEGDVLHFNQSTASAGRVSLLKNPADGTHASAYYPSDTTASRALIITYYVDRDTHRLMRQVNAHAATALADNVADLKITYDLYDDTNQQTSVNTVNANNFPNQIRKVNITVTVYGSANNSVDGRPHYFNLRTSVSVRNMAFKDRYS